MDSPAMSLGSSEALAAAAAAGTGAGATGADAAPPIFTELFELCKYDDGYQEWKEISRWIKYEETVEEAGNRWSKPHVSTPSLRGWLELRRSLRDGLVLVDVEARDFKQVTEIAANKLVAQDIVTQEVAKKLRELWTRKHRHQFEGPRKAEGNLTRAIKDLLVQKLENKAAERGLRVPEQGSRRSSFSARHRNAPPDPEGDQDDGIDFSASSHIDRSSSSALMLEDGRVNTALTKKISSSTEAAVILVGAVPFLDRPVSILVRLAKPMVLGDMPEVDIPTRFLYFFTGPPTSATDGDNPHQSKKDTAGERGLYADLGVSLATAITDRTFAAALFNAKSPDEIRDALDAYTNGLKILPSEYNTDLNKIEPPTNKETVKLEEEEEIDEDRRMREQSGLVRSGRLFGGLVQDIRRKKRFYFSDFIQGLHPQCISSFLFLYFACLAPIVAFGALLGKATENRIATIESLMSGVISGVLFGLFSGQPLIILGSTGPVYVFEKILYQICTDQNWDYLSLRLWIGLWVGVILILLVALDASALVCYITRFTEELFATLIAFIFIVNAFGNLVHISEEYAFSPNGTDIGCECRAPENDSVAASRVEDWAGLDKWQCDQYKGTKIGANCDFEPNIFLMSLVLFSGTFTIAYTLKNFRNTGYLPGSIRDFLSDFAVIIAILTGTAVSFFSGTHTPRLVVPDSFAPTYEGREWFVAHGLIVADHLLTNPWWVDVFLAPVLALLATILIFMDQQITAVIVNRKEHKLRKGGGYHLDLLILAVIVIICSVFGLPWFVAATVLSINHIQSLTKESESSAPGEKPQFLGIREQRVTAVLIALAIGLSTFITPILAVIPMPVLYGVFLFMGVSSLKGLQFFDRLLLLFIPRKYQPDYVFLKYVPLHRVHLFTFFQLTSLILLWAIKNEPTTSISFPIMLVVICAIRKFMECVFSKHELRALDDLLPEASSKKRRAGGKGGIFNKIHSRADMAYEMERAKKKEAEEEAERIKLLHEESRNRAMGIELDDYGRVDIRAKTKQYSDLVRAATAAAAARTSRSNSIYPGSPPPGAAPAFKGAEHHHKGSKNVVFVKMSDQEVYTPLNVNTRTVSGLLRRLEAKFPARVREDAVANLYQKSKKNLMFHLDDDMVDMITAGQVFDVEVEESEENPGKQDITLKEVDK